MVYDSPIQPMLLACDTAGNMLVVSSPPPRFRPTTRPAPTTLGAATAPVPRPQGPRRPNVGAMYTLNTDPKNEGVIAIKPLTGPFPDGAIAFHPLPWSDPASSDPNAPPPAYTLAPDAKTIIPSNRGLYDAVQLRAAIPGQPFYLPDAGNHKTWAFTVNPDGSLAHPKLFAEEGEGGLAVDSHGNVYLAAGAVFVYDPTGKRLGMIAVPEHPTSLVFGGADGKTLFITARTSLYAIKTATNGR